MKAAVFLALVASVCSITSAQDSNLSRAWRLMGETPLIDGWVETSASLIPQPGTSSKNLGLANNILFFFHAVAGFFFFLSFSSMEESEGPACVFM